MERYSLNNPFPEGLKTREVEEAVTSLFSFWNYVFINPKTPSTLIEQAVEQGIISAMESFTMRDLIQIEGFGDPSAV